MKRWVMGSLMLCMILMVCNAGQAQIFTNSYGGGLWPAYTPSFLSVARIASAFPALYYTPRYPTMPFLPVPSLVPQPLPVASWPPFFRRPLAAPMTLPPPLFRNAAATITIIFNPAVSIVNVSALPLTSLTPIAAVTPAITPAIAPPVALTALALALPALISAVPTKPYAYTQTISTTVLPTAVVPPTAISAIPGLTALLAGI